jgi:hypothetical protein
MLRRKGDLELHLTLEPIPPWDMFWAMTAFPVTTLFNLLNPMQGPARFSPQQPHLVLDLGLSTHLAGIPPLLCHSPLHKVAALIGLPQLIMPFRTVGGGLCPRFLCLQPRSMKKVDGNLWTQSELYLHRLHLYLLEDDE